MCVCVCVYVCVCVCVCGGANYVYVRVYTCVNVVLAQSFFDGKLCALQEPSIIITINRKTAALC